MRDLLMLASEILESANVAANLAAAVAVTVTGTEAADDRTGSSDDLLAGVAAAATATRLCADAAHALFLNIRDLGVGERSDATGVNLSFDALAEQAASADELCIAAATTLEAAAVALRRVDLEIAAARARAAAKSARHVADRASAIGSDEPSIPFVDLSDLTALDFGPFVVTDQLASPHGGRPGGIIRMSGPEPRDEPRSGSTEGQGTDSSANSDVVARHTDQKDGPGAGPGGL